MGLFDLGYKQFLSQFKSGEWRSEAERLEAVAAVRATQKMPFRQMLSIIQTAHPSETNKDRVKSRMQCLEELCVEFKEASMIPPMLDAIGAVDAITREYLIRILRSLYQKEFSAIYVDLLKSDNDDVRIAVRDILREVGGRTAFELLSDRINSNSFTVYTEAIDIVAEIAGHHSIDLLKKIVSGRRMEDRLYALDVLANPRFMKLRKRRALEAAFEFISDPDQTIRAKIIAIIRQYGEATDVQLLLDLLKIEEKKNLQLVIEALGDIGNGECVPSIIPLLDSTHTGIKVAAITTLGRFEDERSIEPLIDCLRDRNLLIRQKAIEVLGSLGSSENVRLGKLLVAMMKDKDVNVRRSVVEVIRLLGDREDVWWKLIRYLRDEDWWVRERVTEILSELGGVKIIEPIVSLLDDPNEVVRRYAIEVLMRLKDPRAVDPLIRSLRDPDWWVRERSIEALANLKDPRAVPELNAMLAEPELIWTVSVALQQFGHPSSYLPLLQALDHPLPEIRVEIIKALHAIGDRRFAETLKALLNDDDKNVCNLVLTLLPKYNLSPTGVRRKTYEQMSMALLDQMLLDLKAKGGEDLFITADTKPMMKVRGDVEVLDDHVFTEKEVEVLLIDIMSPIQKELFAKLEDIDMSYSISGDGSRFRVNIYRIRSGMAAVFRVIGQQVISMEQLRLPKPVFDFTNLKQGLILVTGPTGSGKSTTLAAMIDHMNQNRKDHIVTIEDPIEYLHTNKECIINQREVGAHTFSFSNALKSALREDPDIILVGEMRDIETISIAITAAETGHLVLGTLHTVSAAKTVDRIIDVFPGRSQAQVRAMLSESLRGVMSQQLMKRKDTDGRILAMEIMICNDAISNLIRKEKVFQIPSILTTSFEMGMTLMDNELLRLVKEGLIYPEDAYIKAINKKEFEPYLVNSGSIILG